MAEPPADGPTVDRLRAAKAVVPFLLIGLADVALLLRWGVDVLWALLILPPILFLSGLAWVAFRSGFVHDRTATEGSDTERGHS